MPEKLQADEKAKLQDYSIKGLYRGLSTNLSATMASYAIYFWWHSLFQQVFRESKAQSSGGHIDVAEVKLSTVELFMATSMAGVLATILTNPLWFINTRVSLSKGDKGLLSIVRDIYKSEGLGAFFKGVIPNIILVVNPIINFMVYESLKQQFYSTKDALHASLTLFVISSLSKSCATFVTYPILTIRVRLQAIRNDEKHVNYWEILTAGGLTGMYAGISAKFVHTVLNNACMMTLYEGIRVQIRHGIAQVVA